ncbi:hypothetical protein E2C01_091639 [Portunus trituberculatus]|uniref:Uncharacterized protein n=1 Tax=Portunus trituberculatus TaxID=210409 RepID=A0A5B7JI14_PORTR|nr:hypothetical protein [Portunus trituberculatus]
MSQPPSCWLPGRRRLRGGVAGRDGWERSKVGRGGAERGSVKLQLSRMEARLSHSGSCGHACPKWRGEKNES